MVVILDIKKVQQLRAFCLPSAYCQPFTDALIYCKGHTDLSLYNSGSFCLCFIISILTKLFFFFHWQAFLNLCATTILTSIRFCMRLCPCFLRLSFSFLSRCLFSSFCFFFSFHFLAILPCCFSCDDCLDFLLKSMKRNDDNHHSLFASLHIPKRKR